MYFIANGGISDYPKNTKEGVLLSKFDKDIDGVLIDVRLTLDNKLVLSENDFIFNNYYISKMNYKDIKKINIGSGINNYYIPLLEEILLYYDKDILIIKLHHNYDQNENLVLELKRILNKYYVKRLIIVVGNDNLYDYLKLYTDYEIYFFNNNENFINIDINIKNYNGNLINKSSMGDFNDLIGNSKDVFIITNNSKILKNII